MLDSFISIKLGHRWTWDPCLSSQRELEVTVCTDKLEFCTGFGFYSDCNVPDTIKLKPDNNSAFWMTCLLSSKNINALNI